MKPLEPSVHRPHSLLFKLSRRLTQHCKAIVQTSYIFAVGTVIAAVSLDLYV